MLSVGGVSQTDPVVLMKSYHTGNACWKSLYVYYVNYILI